MGVQRCKTPPACGVALSLSIHVFISSPIHSQACSTTMKHLLLLLVLLVMKAITDLCNADYAQADTVPACLTDVTITCSANESCCTLGKSLSTLNSCVFFSLPAQFGDSYKGKIMRLLGQWFCLHKGQKLLLGKLNIILCFFFLSSQSINQGQCKNESASIG